MNSIYSIELPQLPSGSVEVDNIDCENVPVLHLSSQDFPTDFDMNDFLRIEGAKDVIDTSEQIVIENPNVLQLSHSKCSSSDSSPSPSVNEKSQPSKRKGAKAPSSSSTVTEKKTKAIVRGKKNTKNCDKLKRNVHSELVATKSDSNIVSLNSFSPLQRFGKMKKEAKCRLVKAKATIVEYDTNERNININKVALGELEEKIASTKAQLVKMCEDVDELRSKVAKDEQFNQYLKKQAQAELVESTRLYETALSMRDIWRTELESVFQSDSD